MPRIQTALLLLWGELDQDDQVFLLGKLFRRLSQIGREKFLSEHGQPPPVPTVMADQFLRVKEECCREDWKEIADSLGRFQEYYLSRRRGVRSGRFRIEDLLDVLRRAVTQGRAVMDIGLVAKRLDLDVSRDSDRQILVAGLMRLHEKLATYYQSGSASRPFVQVDRDRNTIRILVAK
jgi:hypothetical protein